MNEIRSESWAHHLLRSFRKHAEHDAVPRDDLWHWLASTASRRD